MHGGEGGLMGCSVTTTYVAAVAAHPKKKKIIIITIICEKDSNQPKVNHVSIHPLKSFFSPLEVVKGVPFALDYEQDFCQLHYGTYRISYIWGLQPITAIRYLNCLENNLMWLLIIFSNVVQVLFCM